MEKVLTVIIPAFNREKTLARALDSLTAPETGGRLEVLVIDDGSLDRTAAIAQAYCLRYPGMVRLIRQENRGHGGAVNRGMAEARGTYVKVLDGDDRLDPDRLPDFLDALERISWDVVLTGFAQYNEDTGAVSLQQAAPETWARETDVRGLLQQLPLYRPVLTFHGVTCRRAYYESLHLQLTEKVYYEDMEYMMVPVCCAGSLGALGMTLYQYRVGDPEQSISRENRCARIGHREKVLRDLLQYPEQYTMLREPERRTLYERLLRSFLVTYLMILLLDLGDRREASALLKRVRTRSFALARQLWLPEKLFSLLSRFSVPEDRAEAWLQGHSRA